MTYVGPSSCVFNQTSCWQPPIDALPQDVVTIAPSSLSVVNLKVNFAAKTVVLANSRLVISPGVLLTTSPNIGCRPGSLILFCFFRFSSCFTAFFSWNQCHTGFVVTFARPSDFRPQRDLFAAFQSSSRLCSAEYLHRARRQHQHAHRYLCLCLRIDRASLRRDCVAVFAAGCRSVRCALHKPGRWCCVPDIAFLPRLHGRQPEHISVVHGQFSRFDYFGMCL